MTRKQRDILIYQIADFRTAMIAWACFFVYRKKVEGVELSQAIFEDFHFWYGIVLIPLGWVFFYAIFDKYRDIYRLSRLATLTRTFFLSFIGVLFLFFTLILDDFVSDYRTYYRSILTLFSLHFLLTAFVRMMIITRATWRLKAGEVTYNTLIIGGNQKAIDLFEEITNREKGLGFKFIGFIDANGKSANELINRLPKLICDVTMI